jgi:hypothetical protein
MVDQLLANAYLSRPSFTQFFLSTTSKFSPILCPRSTSITTKVKYYPIPSLALILNQLSTSSHRHCHTMLTSTQAQVERRWQHRGNRNLRGPGSGNLCYLPAIELRLVLRDTPSVGGNVTAAAAYRLSSFAWSCVTHLAHVVKFFQCLCGQSSRAIVVGLETGGYLSVQTFGDGAALGSSSRENGPSATDGFGPSVEPRPATR